mmetsp:Transcript_29834/g.65213  ORF Transcript_29834/g.65213 Transcript_29834/m.65213 type:complete len:545 (+) Transcript_29834:395-2029(+)
MLHQKLLNTSVTLAHSCIQRSLTILLCFVHVDIWVTAQQAHDLEVPALHCHEKRGAPIQHHRHGVDVHMLVQHQLLHHLQVPLRCGNIQRCEAPPVGGVDVDAGVPHQEPHHLPVPLLGRHVDGRHAVLHRGVHVHGPVPRPQHERAHHLHVALLRRDVEWGAPVLGGLVDVRAGVLEQRDHHLEMPLLRGHVEGRDAVLLRPVHVQLRMSQQLPYDVRVALLRGDEERREALLRLVLRGPRHVLAQLLERGEDAAGAHAARRPPLRAPQAVHIELRVLHQLRHHLQVPPQRRLVQGGGPARHGPVDVDARVQHQQLHHLHMPLLRRAGQRRAPLLVLRVDVDPLLDQRGDAALVPLARGVVQRCVARRVPRWPLRARQALREAALRPLEARVLRDGILQPDPLQPLLGRGRGPLAIGGPGGILRLLLAAAPPARRPPLRRRRGAPPGGGGAPPRGLGLGGGDQLPGHEAGQLHPHGHLLDAPPQDAEGGAVGRGLGPAGGHQLVHLLVHVGRLRQPQRPRAHALLDLRVVGHEHPEGVVGDHA